MAIDGVGRGNVPGGVPPVPSQGVGETTDFQVGSADAIRSTVGSEALERLQRGELTVDQYLEAQVAAATAHLQSLPAERLEVVRGMLREALRSDPVLVELVRRATGVVPTELEP